ncbi:MAG: dTDP-glucose 4,6-dehydratase [Candidatus Omnitrophica bacterium]|nr:dTDP-glucose 4,6-dehydratase [Candidatus Omnitrophota bacterium]
MPRKKVLITGGAGFIGSNFIRYLLNAYSDLRVINFDALTYAGNPDNLADIAGDPRYEFVRGDIANGAQVSAVMRRVNAVVHFAAESHVDRSIEGPEVFIRTNTLGTQVLLDHARACGVERFVQVSTDEVYGSLGPNGAFTEKSPLSPNSPYAASKASADLLAAAYHHTYGLPVIITRCSNNYGPYQFPEKLIPLMIANALGDQPLPVYGDGQNVRDWIYVEDHCRAVDMVLRQGRPGEIYNIGANNEWRNIDIVKLILKELGKPESLIRFVDDRLGHDRRYAIDSGKIRNEFGWEPRALFEESIKKTIRWYRENIPWMQRIQSGQYRGGY